MSKCLNPDCLSVSFPQDNFCQQCGQKLRLKERYRAIKVIGEGGFGRTFLAIDEDKPSKPNCVIKQFLPQAQGTSNIEKASELFAQEAERLDELGKHAQIPELLGYFTQDNRQYLIQEFVDGQNLQQELNSQGNFNEQKIKALLADILPILKYVHENKVIHRDIKPENIIRRASDQKLFLVDFGASKVIENTRLSVTATVIGSAQYCSPEQSFGKPKYCSDLYSLGVTCLHLLTGIDPFDLFDPGEGEWVWRDYLVNNHVSKDFGQILDKLVESAYKRRYQYADEVIKILNSNYIFYETQNTQLRQLEESEVLTELTEYYSLEGLTAKLIEDVKNSGYIKYLPLSKTNEILNENTLKYLQEVANHSEYLAEIVLRYHNDHKCSQEEAKKLATELRQLSIELSRHLSVYDLNIMYKVVKLFTYQISRFKHSKTKYCWDTFMKEKMISKLDELFARH